MHLALPTLVLCLVLPLMLCPTPPSSMATDHKHHPSSNTSHSSGYKKQTLHSKHCRGPNHIRTSHEFRPSHSCKKIAIHIIGMIAKTHYTSNNIKLGNVDIGNIASIGSSIHFTTRLASKCIQPAYSACHSKFKILRVVP